MVFSKISEMNWFTLRYMFFTWLASSSLPQPYMHVLLSPLAARRASHRGVERETPTERERDALPSPPLHVAADATARPPPIPPRRHLLSPLAAPPTGTSPELRSARRSEIGNDLRPHRNLSPGTLSLSPLLSRNLSPLYSLTETPRKCRLLIHAGSPTTCPRSGRRNHRNPVAAPLTGTTPELRSARRSRDQQ